MKKQVKEMLKGLSVAALFLAAMHFAGCAALNNAKQNAAAIGAVATALLPTSTQLLASCAAETAAGKTGLARPDCVAWTIMNNNCKNAAMAPALAPLVGMATVAFPQAAVPASMLNMAVNVDIGLCTSKGFYAPAPVITIAPVATAVPATK